MARSLGLGCMRLSTEATRPDDATARSIVDAAITAGITLLDTADVYCHSDADLGHNERLLAGVPPHVRIVTKGGLTRPDGAWVPNGRAKHIASAARASLARLGRIDLYLLHAIDPKVPLGTSVRALARLVDDGIVPAIGLSNVNLTQLEATLAIAPIAAVEVELHPYKLDALRGGLLDACTSRGIEVLAHRPFGGPRGVARLSRDAVVREHARRLSCTPAELILAWLRSLSPMVIPLPGASRTETAVSAANEIELDADAKRALDDQFVTVASTKPARMASTKTAGVASAKAASNVGEITRGERTSRSADPEAHAVPLSAGSAGKVGGDVGEIKRGDRTSPSADPEPRAVPLSANWTGEVVGDVGEIKRAERTSPFANPGARAVIGEVVLVVGIPGAGKSTLATDLLARGYVRLNRDDRGGSLLELARALDAELANGATHVVLDNTYPSRASRRPVIDIARRYGLTVRCIVVDTPIERAQHNAVLRMLERHGRLLEPQELRGTDIGPGAQFRWRREYEPPRTDEGFDAIEILAFADRNASDSSNASDPPNASDPSNASDERYASHRPIVEGNVTRAILVELDDIVWRGRPRTVDKIALHDGVLDALRAWHAAGFAIVATSWQPGVAPTKFAQLVAHLGTLLDMPLRASACFHAAGPPVCWCRKPLPGLALAMAKHHSLRFELVIGSGAADKGFASRAGIRYHDVREGWQHPSTMNP